jgi:hypothetical protein
MTQQPGEWHIRVVVPMDLLSDVVALHAHSGADHPRVTVSVAGQYILATIDSFLPIASQQLPATTLSVAGGGEIQSNPDDPQVTVEPFFELRLVVEEKDLPLYDGQGATVLLDLPARSVWQRFWLWGLRLWQRRSIA